MTLYSPHHSPDGEHVFGIPLTLTDTEASHLRVVLSQVWELTYGEAPAETEQDIARCRDFFDPTVRGFKLRERIATLPEVPESTRDAVFRIAAQLVTDAGDGRLIAGVEARLVLDLLKDGYRHQSGGHWILPDAAARAAEGRALQAYRTWSVRKLSEAIALQAGQGKEALQATSVGLMLALLVNRADSPERAVMRPDDGAGHPVDEALHSAALAFADGITAGRATTGKPRSPDERRLHGGYMLTEARRRLAGKMSGYPEAVYIRPGATSEVVEFLAGELARRKNLTDDQLSDAFARLVDSFRANARSLAAHNAIFESPAATRNLREELLAAFTKARKR
jgi:hypothetical protein